MTIPRTLFLLALALVPASLHAAGTDTSSLGFVPLTNIPGIAQAGNSATLPDFLNNLYKLCIGAAGILAVIQIIRAGIIYMGGDSITEKKEAKSIITLAISGLVLVLSPVIVFSIINPKILDLQIGVDNLAPSTSTASSTATGTTETTAQICANFEQATAAPSTATCAAAVDPDFVKVTDACCAGLSASSQCCARPK